MARRGKINDDIKAVMTALVKDPALRKKVEAAKTAKAKKALLKDAGLNVSFSKEDVDEVRVATAITTAKTVAKATGLRRPGPAPQNTVEWVAVVVAVAALATGVN